MVAKMAAKPLASLVLLLGVIAQTPAFSNRYDQQTSPTCTSHEKDCSSQESTEMFQLRCVHGEDHKSCRIPI